MFIQVAAVGERLDHRRHYFLAVDDGHGIDDVVPEPLRIAGGIVAADVHECIRHLALDPLRQPHGAVALRREVAL